MNQCLSSTNNNPSSVFLDYGQSEDAFGFKIIIILQTLLSDIKTRFEQKNSNKYFFCCNFKKIHKMFLKFFLALTRK